MFLSFLGATAIAYATSLWVCGVNPLGCVREAETHAGCDTVGSSGLAPDMCAALALVRVTRPLVAKVLTLW